MNTSPIGYFTLGAVYPRDMLRERYPMAKRRGIAVLLGSGALTKIHVSSFGVTLAQRSDGVSLSQRSFGVSIVERSFDVTGGQ